jgi:hypothetical protein
MQNHVSVAVFVGVAPVQEILTAAAEENANVNMTGTEMKVTEAEIGTGLIEISEVAAIEKIAWAATAIAVTTDRTATGLTTVEALTAMGRTIVEVPIAMAPTTEVEALVVTVVEEIQVATDRAEEGIQVATDQAAEAVGIAVTLEEAVAVGLAVGLAVGEATLAEGVVVGLEADAAGEEEVAAERTDILEKITTFNATCRTLACPMRLFWDSSTSRTLKRLLEQDV